MGGVVMTSLWWISFWEGGGVLGVIGRLEVGPWGDLVSGGVAWAGGGEVWVVGGGGRRPFCCMIGGMGRFSECGGSMLGGLGWFMVGGVMVWLVVW